MSSNNLEYKDYDYLVEFENFSQLSKEYLIEIFESEYKDWFVDRLESLYPEDTSCFNINEQIVLKICMSFPETFYKLKNPQNIRNKRAKGQD